MKTKMTPFEIHIPDVDGQSAARKLTLDVPARWDEVIDEWVLTEEAHARIANRKALEMGILSPAQLTGLRERHNCTRKEMGVLFQVGEKSWHRWENGKNRPTRSMNLLIRALYDRQISINYLRKKAGMPIPKKQLPSASTMTLRNVRNASISASRAANNHSPARAAKYAVRASTSSFSAGDWKDSARYEELTL